MLGARELVVGEGIHNGEVSGEKPVDPLLRVAFEGRGLEAALEEAGSSEGSHFPVWVKLPTAVVEDVLAKV